MLARRLLLFAALMLLAIAVSSAIAPREDDDGGTAAPTLPAGAASPERVRATLPSSDPVVARVGDVVELTVTAEVAERAAILDLGVDAPVGPGLTGKLLFTADRAGRFPVTLRYGGRRIGTLDVRGS